MDHVRAAWLALLTVGNFSMASGLLKRYTEPTHRDAQAISSL
jgi:hypothetical protein